MKIQLRHTYHDIISLENLTLAWQEFADGKKGKRDVQAFAQNLMDHILALHEDLVNMTYQHSGYESFFINDPKKRHIHKATVRDRLLHHAVYRVLYPFFDRTFISDSYSCRLGKGTYKAMTRFRQYAGQVSKNHTETCWVLKCDIRQFFASIDYSTLLMILEEYIPDQDILNLLENIINSFEIEPDSCVGLPLGNLTSQLLVNVYMNRLDQWAKHSLKAKYYIRYADDFVFLSTDKKWLESIIPKLEYFLLNELSLTLHPKKIILKTFASGVDFLGWVHFPHHTILRKVTERRIFRRIQEETAPETYQSYMGLLRHGDTFQVQERLKLYYWLWQ